MEYFRKDGRIITYGLSSLVKSIAPIGMPYQRKGNGRDYLGAIHTCYHAGSVRVVAGLPDRASSLCSRGLSAAIPPDSVAHADVSDRNLHEARLMIPEWETLIIYTDSGGIAALNPRLHKDFSRRENTAPYVFLTYMPE